MRRITFLWILFFSFCLRAETESAPVVASFSILEDIARNLLPTQIKTATLIPPGLDPHSYQAKSEDFLKLKKAKVILSVGQDFDSWIKKATEKSKSQALLVECSSSAKLLKGSSHHHNHLYSHPHDNQFDPHFWHSPEQALNVIRSLKKEFVKQFPEHQKEIELKSNHYVTQIQKIQNGYKKEFQKLNPQQRKIVLPHNSFRYFAHEFDVEVLSPLDMNQEGEASVKQVAELASRIKKERIGSLFIEKSSPQGLMQALSKETNYQIRGTLFSDTLSASKEASTYLLMLQSNFDLILKSMKGSPQ
jgi:zinc/manganese transport system substrate-binding protein